MLDYARQRAIEALKDSKRAVMATSGPAGIQAGEFPCEAAGLDLYILVPKFSDLIFNLEQNHSVTVLTPRWEVKGEAELIAQSTFETELGLLRGQEAELSILVRVRPRQIHILREKGWGYRETIEI